MRTYPTTEEELSELSNLNASEWQINLLKLNPDYVYWGNFEDYMCNDNGGWSARCNLKAWSEHFELDDLNELVNFYFKLNRKSHECASCKGSGLNSATNRIADEFYDFEGTGRRWCDKITQDEVEALQNHSRLRVWEDGKWQKKVGLTAKEVNNANERGGWGDFKHDAINRCILIETRAKRLGVYGNCETCGGIGHLFDSDTAHISLQLWILHPRKGCSRGVYIEKIEEHEVEQVIAYLKEAHQRNTNRFSKILEL